MHRVFVNYRTGDAEWAATNVNIALSDEFGAHRIFWAPKSIPPGADFERDILGSLRKCSVLLALIGPKWLTATGADGRRRLDDPTDWVRREIAAAFRLGITVVPVLIDGTERLTNARVPDDIDEIRRAQSLLLDHGTVFSGMAAMIAAVRDRVPDLAPDEPPLSPAGDGPPPDQTWRGGDEIELSNRRYLVHDGVGETVPRDHSWVFRHADTYRLDRNPSVVRLRQVRVLSDTAAARRRRAALLQEATVLTSLLPVTGMPRLAETLTGPGSVTLVLDQQAGKSLRSVYGPCEWPLDYFRVNTFLRVLRSLSAVLGELHQRGLSHRALDPDVVLLPSGAAVCLRDVGLATVTPGFGEGTPPYQAPEQWRATRPAIGSRVDVYQVAAIAYHVLTGYPPTAGTSPPVRAVDFRLPGALDDLLGRALAADPALRPADGTALAARFGQVLDATAGRI
ncbi:MAG TPA: TIR domain-containing protein [Pseudonocardiaceae bacterium]|nr:TIR domain-containing protein [Pseudonocardiaceae bacterium]